MLARAPLLPKFVWEGAAIYHELRKQGTKPGFVGYHGFVTLQARLPARSASADGAAGILVHDGGERRSRATKPPALHDATMRTARAGIAGKSPTCCARPRIGERAHRGDCVAD